MAVAIRPTELLRLISPSRCLHGCCEVASTSRAEQSRPTPFPEGILVSHRSPDANSMGLIPNVLNFGRGERPGCLKREIYFCIREDSGFTSDCLLSDVRGLSGVIWKHSNVVCGLQTKSWRLSMIAHNTDDLNRNWRSSYETMQYGWSNRYIGSQLSFGMLLGSPPQQNGSEKQKDGESRNPDGRSSDQSFPTIAFLF